MKTTFTLIALAASAGVSSAAWTATNLSFETGGQPPAPWAIQSSTGTDPIEGEDFRTATDPDNWYPDSTAGNTVQLLEMDNSNEAGFYGQLMSGTAEAGTYSWTLFDVGVTNFADNNGAILRYGISTSATSFSHGFTELTEGSEIFSPANNPTGQYSGTANFVSDGTEAQLYLLFERPSGHTGRSTISIGSTTLEFAAVPEPSSAALLGLGGIALILRRRR